MPINESISSRLDLILEVEKDGSRVSTRLPVAQTRITYVLNRVSEASFVLAVGYRLPNLVKDIYGNSKTKVEKLTSDYISKITSDRVKITASVAGKGRMSYGRRLGSRGSRRWPSSPVKIFDGRIVGVNYTRASGQIQLVLNAASWLNDLDYGTMASADIAKGSFDNMLASISEDSESGTASYLLSENILAVSLSIEQQKTNKSIDLWKDVILFLLLQAITSADPEDPNAPKGLLREEAFYVTLLNEMERQFPGAAASPEVAKLFSKSSVHIGNALAYKVLTDRFVNVDTSKFKPGNLELKYGGNDGEDRELPVVDMEKLVSGITSILTGNVGSTTVLNKLTTLSQSLMFDIVTSAEYGTIVPSTPVFRREYAWRVLEPDDLVSIQGSGVYPRKLAGVAMVGAIDTDDVASGLANEEFAINGVYIGREEGQIKIYRAPDWLLSGSSTAEKALTSKEILGAKSTNAVGLITKAREGTSVQGPPEEAPKKERDRLKTGCLFAKNLWANEAFKYTQAIIRTPFRLDICPGSLLELRGIQLFDEKKRDSSKSAILGQAAVVSLILDAGSPNAVTEIQLTHVRDAYDDSVPASNPIYQNVWRGGPIATAYNEDTQPYDS